MSDEKKSPTDGIALTGGLSESLQSAHEALAEVAKISRDQFKGFDRLAKLFPEEQLKAISAVDSAARLFADQVKEISAMGSAAKVFAEQMKGTCALDSMRVFAEQVKAISAAESVAKLFADQVKGFSALDSMKVFADQVKGINALSAMSAMRALQDSTASILAEQASAYSRLFERMRPVIPPPLIPAFDRKLFDAIAPSATLLGALGENSGVLTNLDGVEDVVGTVSWLAPEGDAHVVHAAGILDRESGAGERLDIEVEIGCALCGELMPVPQRSVEWQSPTKAKIDVKVLPVCPRCVHELQGSPEYWIEKFKELQRPKLKLIRGDGQSPDHAGRNHLRLVEDRNDEE